MLGFIYTICIRLYGLLITVAALRSTSAKSWKSVRKNNLQKLQTFRSSDARELIWVHCASQGEYEQALPIIEQIRTDYSNCLVALTFYSPSGLKSIHESSPVDWVGFLPLDTKRNMQRFVSTLRPQKTIIIKNEWWWNMLDTLLHANIPYHFVSSTIRENHYFIKYTNSFFEKYILGSASYGVIDTSSLDILTKKYPNKNAYISGDTRVNRVLKIANQEEPSFLHNSTLPKRNIVYGSVWESDIPIIQRLIECYPNYIHVLFPHKLDALTIKAFKSTFYKHKNNVLIIDKMGILAKAYRYATFSYVGGGFGAGIHNVLEAAVYETPVIIGPNYSKSSEAIALVNLDVVYSILSPRDIYTSQRFDSDKVLDKAKNNAQVYFEAHQNSLKEIMNAIFDA